MGIQHDRNLSPGTLAGHVAIWIGASDLADRLNNRRSMGSLGYAGVRDFDVRALCVSLSTNRLLCSMETIECFQMLSMEIRR
jgi:hypothetical protein